MANAGPVDVLLITLAYNSLWSFHPDFNVIFLESDFSIIFSNVFFRRIP